MPIFDQGYQHWQGKLSGHGWRWLTITRQGFRTQSRAIWIRAMTWAALIPGLALAGFLILWGLLEQKYRAVLDIIPFLPEHVKLAPEQYRGPIWALAFKQFFVFELYLSMFLVMLVGPSLISKDLRFNALPLYFSKPLRRLDYFVGKFGVIAMFLGGVALVPAVIAYVLGVLFSLDLGVIRDTWWVLGRGLLYGLIIVVSAGTLMLALSSLSRKSLYVGAMWMGLWLVSGAVAGILADLVRADWCPAVSYTGNLYNLGEVLLDTENSWKQLEPRPPVQNVALGPSRPQGPPRGGAPKGPGQTPPPAPPPSRPPPTRNPEPEPPWYLSAGILAGLLGLSLCILTFRVKSLDRLR
jgi:ABC-2 type transport system permease protein